MYLQYEAEGYWESCVLLWREDGIGLFCSGIFLKLVLNPKSNVYYSFDKDLDGPRLPSLEAHNSSGPESKEHSHFQSTTIELK